MQASYHYSFNAQAPDGNTFIDADAVIYAKAFYKPRLPEVKTLKVFIQNDFVQSLSESSGIHISKVLSLKTASGQVLQTYMFTPSKDGNWELVAYGEEGDFYLVFCLSSRNKGAFDKALSDFKSFVSNYHEQQKLP